MNTTDLRQTTDPPDALAHYLRRSTRGLSGRRRRLLEAELRGHVEARAHELALVGLAGPAATQQALRELGRPEVVSRGMAGVYLLPGALRATTLTALLGCMALFAASNVTQGLAQVQGYRPSFTLAPGPYTYLETGSLHSELERAGIHASGEDGKLSLTFPDVAGTVTVRSGDLRGGYTQRTLLRDYPSGRRYLDAGALARATLQAAVPVALQGWINPTLTLGTHTLRLGLPDQPVDAYNLYSLALEPLARQLGLNSLLSARWTGLEIASTYQLDLAAAPGAAPRQAARPEVYALVSVARSPIGSAWVTAEPVVLAFDLARPDARGHLVFTLPYDLPDLRLSESAQTLRDEAQQPTSRPTATPHALLLRLSGILNPPGTLAGVAPPYAILSRSDLLTVH